MVNTLVSQSAGSFDDMQDVHTGHKTDKGVVRKYDVEN